MGGPNFAHGPGMAAALGDDALESADRAAREGNYEAAYHFLMAAIHVADKSGDRELVTRACAIGQRCKDEIDTLRPEHPLSGAAAERRRQTPLFDALQTHGKSVLLRHRMER